MLLSEWHCINSSVWLTAGTRVKVIKSLVYGGDDGVHSASYTGRPARLFSFGRHQHTALFCFTYLPLSDRVHAVCRRKHASCGSLPAHTLLGWSSKRYTSWCTFLKLIACMNMSLNGFYLRRYIWWMMRWILSSLLPFLFWWISCGAHRGSF